LQCEVGSAVTDPTSELGSAPDGQILGLQTAAADLTLDKSLARLVSNAKFVISTVAVVSTALTGFGLISAGALTADSAARPFAISAAIFAPLALLLSLVPLVLRQSKVNLANLAAVESWYDKQLGRGKFVTAAGLALAFAVVCASAAATIVVMGSGKANINYSLVVTRGNANTTATVEIRGTRLRPGRIVQIRLAGVSGTGTGQQILIRAALQADADGSISASDNVPLPTTVTNVLLSIDGQQTATFPTGATDK
jgi:hypothetical protein